MKPLPWRAGMRTSTGAIVLSVANDGEYLEFRWGWEQALTRETDPNDPATLGALLAAVREAWRISDLYPCRISEGRMPNTWRVGPPAAKDEPPFREGWGFRGRCVKEGELARRVGIQPTEFAALLAAWEAAPC